MKIEGQKRYRAFLILMAYLIMVMSGIRNGTTYFENTSHEFLYIMVLALTLTNICIVDGKITGKPLSIFSYWIVFIFYGIAVPVCIIRTHGIKGIPLVLLHSLGHVNSYFTQNSGKNRRFRNPGLAGKGTKAIISISIRSAPAR